MAFYAVPDVLERGGLLTIRRIGNRGGMILLF